MLPDRRGHQCSTRWLPRTRGDAPPENDITILDESVAPHTRGCSAPVPLLRERRGGCPAHAGMLPPAPRSPPPRCRLPRTRGDAPPQGLPVAFRLRVAPHTRGCSRHAGAGGQRNPGCPTHVGMLHTSTASGTRSLSFPRDRGDAPIEQGDRTAVQSLAPHMRGCSARTQHVQSQDKVCPAHAGMLPSRTSTRPATRWLPRTRGNAPYSRYLAQLTHPVAPHTRGCSWLQRVHDQQRTDSLAPAGMLHTSTAIGTRSLSFPRDRGDACRTQSCSSSSLFPLIRQARNEESL